MKYAILFAMMLSSCIDTKKEARDRFRRATGSDGKCVTENGEGSEFSACTNGRVLILCTADEGCLFINLDPEAVPVVDQPAPLK